MSEVSEARWPPRSALPVALVAFWCLLVALRMRLLSSGSSVPLGPLQGPWAWWALALAGALALVACAWGSGGLERPWLRLGLVLVVSGCAGMAMGEGLLAREARELEVLKHRSVSSLDLAISRAPSPTQTGWWSAASVSSDGRALGSVWISTAEEVRLGERVRAVGRFEANVEDEWGLSSRAQGIVGTVRVLRVLEREPPRGPEALVLGLREVLLAPVEAEGTPGAALMAASALGDKASLKAVGLDETFSAAGLSHLVAVSGLHVSLVLGLLGGALAKTRWRPPARIAALLGAGGAYVLLAGSPASAVRSFAMVACAQLALVAGRRNWAPNALGVGGLAMVFADVRSAGDIGFCLSALCVSAICVLSPWLEAIQGGRRGRERARRDHLARRIASCTLDLARSQALLALLCTIVAAPIVGASFGAVSIVAPLASMLVALPFEGFLALSLAGCFLGWVPFVGSALIAVGSAVGGCLIACIQAMAGLPFAKVAVDFPEPAATLCSFAVIVGLWAWWPEIRGRRLMLYAGTACALAMVGWAVWPLLLGPRIVVLDVGQGDAILVQDGWHAVLVDTGPDEAVAEALLRQGVLSLDGVVLTHQHADHAGGIDELAGVARVGAIIVPEGQGAALAEDVLEAERAFGLRTREMRVGDVLSVGAFTLEMIWPEERADGDENDESLVLAVRCEAGDRELTGLITGDAEADVLEALHARGRLADVDFLKVGHHGSAASVDEESARILAAEVAVASAGEGNSYGHPKPECVRILEGSGSRFLCTKDAGDVEIRPGATGPSVRASAASP